MTSPGYEYFRLSEQDEHDWRNKLIEFEDLYKSIFQRRGYSRADALHTLHFMLIGNLLQDILTELRLANGGDVDDAEDDDTAWPRTEGL